MLFSHNPTPLPPLSREALPLTRQRPGPRCGSHCFHNSCSALAQSSLCSHVLLHQIIYTGAITPESTDENTADDSLILYNKHKIPTVILYPVTAIHMVCLWSPVSRGPLSWTICVSGSPPHRRNSTAAGSRLQG